MEHNPDTTMMIKSIISVGFTMGTRKKIQSRIITLNPDFSQESKVLYANVFSLKLATHSMKKVFWIEGHVERESRAMMKNVALRGEQVGFHLESINTKAV